MSTNFQVSDVQAYAKPYVGNMPLALDPGGQPLLGMCNAVARVILAPPFKWVWNRNSSEFVMTAGTQNYRYAPAWAGGNPYVLGNVVVDSNGNGQKCIVAGQAGGSAPAWATGIFATTTDNTVTWQNIGKVGVIPQVPDFGFIEKAVIQDVNNNNVWKEISVQLGLSRSSVTSRPEYVSAQGDDNAGTITWRFMPVPPAAYPVSIEYQKKAPTFISLSQNWSPIPDDLFEVYSWGVIALAYLFAEDPRFAMAQTQFIARLLSKAEGLTETEVNIFLRNWNASTNTLLNNAQRATQGTQARQAG